MILSPAWRMAAVILAIPHFVLAVLMLARAAGAFQPVELWVRDLWLRQHADEHQSPVLVVGADEDDLNRFGWPLPDERLAQALEMIGAGNPRAIGIDLYRDQPRPPGQERLDKALASDMRIVAAFRLGDAGRGGINPPARLMGTERTGFADMPVEADGLVRRALLYMDDGHTVYTGLAARLALVYLAAEGIQPHGADDGTLMLGATSLPPFESNDGGYAGADDAGYQLMLDYRAGITGIGEVRLGDLLDGKVDAQAMRDKVVLIGVAAESVKDYVKTPLNRGSGAPLFTAGSVVHGHFVDQLIRHARGLAVPTRSLPVAAMAAWTWFWALLATLVAWRLRSPVALIAVSITGFWGIVAAGWAAESLHWWLPVALPASAWLVSAGLTASFLGKDERKQRELLMRMFAANVSPALADEMWRQRATLFHEGRPRPRELTATVLFTDLRDFTTVSEGLDARHLFEWLNSYLEAMSQVVVRHGGVIDKYVGDAIMAVFGVPVAREQATDLAADARSAVDCALDMAAELEALNPRFAAQGLPKASMRVGIFTGPLAAGALGGRERMNYTVIGDSVNVAARLESFDKSVGSERMCRIIAGGPTIALTGDCYNITPVGTLALKGKTQQIDAYLVNGRKDDVAAIAHPSGKETQSRTSSPIRRHSG